MAEVVPSVKDGQLVRRNGIYTITVMADVRRDVNVTALTSVIKEKVAAIPLPDKVTLAYGGDDEQDNENLPPIMAALAIAAFIIFFILLAHFKRISIALLILPADAVCVRYGSGRTDTKDQHQNGNAHLWHGTEDPYLYTLTVTLLKNGKAVDEIATRFGCRSFCY